MAKYEGTNPVEKLHEGETYFFLRAQDTLAPAIVENYGNALRDHGDGHGALECFEIAWEMRKWQNRNPDLVKMPD